jgi:glutathione S-transferase
MAELVLTIANRNYSSWSMRAWLALEQTGAPFREELIWFDEDADRRQRLERSPTGRVPVLRHGQLVVWDSLAIGEYLAETFPEAGLWPPDRAARARARSVCAEMHSGFGAIRSRMPMNVRARKPLRDRGPEVASEIERVRQLWTDARREHGSGGPYLFGTRSLADAFYAPVACRFVSYGVRLDGEAGAYVETLLRTPAVRDWIERAEREAHADPAYDDVP